MDLQAFCRAIALERRRSERSQKSFLLMLVNPVENGSLKKLPQVILNILFNSIRETDMAGWYRQPSTLGIVFTEIGSGDRGANVPRLISRITAKLQQSLSSEQFREISLSFHLFPEDWHQSDDQHPGDPLLYPDLMHREKARKPARAVKRAMDIAGSVTALMILSPVFLVIAIAIRATSRGPVFFRQRRTGELGAPFRMLKFRSMYENNDNNVHKQYVLQLIAGTADKHLGNENCKGVYKLTKDRRITSVGAFLRRTSLDELPQLINVLKGEMSLVGPRPAIDYEVKEYQLWHRRRLIEAKPGITGLWQVGGRNRIPFDQMVRLDLEYARSWSPWLDLKILLRTPLAVIEGAH